MKILNDKFIIDFLDKENNNKQPEFSTKQLQIHIDYQCGCKVTQDKKGNSIFPCTKHEQYIQSLRNNEILHKVIQ